MIAPMKKLSIVLLDKDKQDSLKSLKNLGIMHLSENYGSNDSVKAIEEEIKDVETALKYTDESLADHKTHIDVNEIKDIIAQVDGFGKKIYELEERESKLNRDLEFLEPWGEFNPSDIKLLDDKGIKVTLLEVTKEQMETFPEDIEFFNITHNNLGYLITVIGECPTGYTEFIPPELGIEDSLRSLEIILDEIEENKKELNKLSKYHGKILTYKEYLEDRLEFERVKAGMGYDENFSVLEGWVPVEKVEKFKKKAASNGWGYQLSDPVEGDDTPTLLKSSKVVSLIHPVLDFLGNVPGYWEKDVSPYFLLFFTVFFAMIIGDAGYGSIFLITAILIHLKTKKLTTPLALFYLQSVATVVWGALTGNWFGSSLIKGIPFFNGFVLSQLDTDKEVMELCFNIAVIHLILGRLLALIQGLKNRELNSIANIGWGLMVGGLLFIVRNLVISSTDYPIPQKALFVIAVGFGIVVIFGKQEKGKNFFKGVLSGLLGSLLTALDSIGAFGDIISYIRLYAVGLAGFAVAQSFNVMASSMSESGVFGMLGGSLVLLAGHSFNIAMCILSVLVHGVRLNVLEFSSHADINWTGRKFNPFRDKKIL